jgi:hypothetical protein
MQIMGGSFISTGQLASKFARYQFRPHFFQHATFRVVVSEADLSQYDMTRYGPHNPVVSCQRQAAVASSLFATLWCLCFC